MPQVEDARATMAIYRAHHTEWEASLTAGRPHAAKKAKPTPEARSLGHEAFKQKQSLGLAATLNSTRDDEDGVHGTLHTSEGNGTGATAKPETTSPSTAKRKPSSTKVERKGKANASEWWKEAL
jgi:hypothetical protein